MQKKENDFQRLGICHRLFNFILDSLIGRGLKCVTSGHPVPQDSTNQGPLDEYAKLNGEDDSIVKIHFKQTEELDCWTPVDNLGSSVHPAEKDLTAINGLSGTEIQQLNGISVDNTKPQGQGKSEVRTQGEGSMTPQKIIIPITDRAGQDEKKKKAGNEFPSPITQTQPSKPTLTGLALNINEISDIFIQNTRERISRNISLMEREES
ncbi:hypothetical protein DITRI_Ditri11bG0097900 [Diplodiscus trichospermus]